MALFAAGFNAWNQLDFNAAPTDTDPEDVWVFSKVLQDEGLERPRAGLCYTLVRGSSGYHVAGTGVAAIDEKDVEQMYTACRAGNDLTLAVVAPVPSLISQDDDVETPRRFIEKYACFQDYKSRSKPTKLPCASPVQQVAAYEAGFLVLYQDGTVATLGDPRYQDCLAREVTEKSPPYELCQVPDLTCLGDPVKHVTAGGYILAALTESSSVYVWGRQSGGMGHRTFNSSFDVSGMPNYCEVYGDKDVQDIALGESHAIALTANGEVCVIGTNSNGQLGLGKSRDFHATAWTKLHLDLPTGHHVTGVAAGPRCSFILTAQKATATII
ncbi:hypothetical protein QQS21_010563 [Conoideocrella luteorostrata]|uniref:Uncharacterized protein n=1 Tax=Conoideocrella luteorostrata TaxID=1105319 RepID=A0AAJ0CHG5_9HYPO|nr:hypothetical protein QQS21_010563 [Conoideocrella luteorostrata]